MKPSNTTIDIIKALFSCEQHESVKELLLTDCSNNLPGCKDWNQSQLDRIWLSVLKISEGDLEKLYSAIALAQTDYRDLFMCAGFGYDTGAHTHWKP